MVILLRPAEVPSDLVCAICMSVPLEPACLETCEHIFCHECARQSLSRNPACPIDRVPCTIQQVQPLRRNGSFAYRIWSSVMVQCDNFDSCSWRGSIADLKSHQENCSAENNGRIMSRRKEEEYTARIDHLTWEVSLLTANQRALESTNHQLNAQNEELRAALQAKNHALRTTVDVLYTAISNNNSSSSSSSTTINDNGNDGDTATTTTNSAPGTAAPYDRKAVLQLVQQIVCHQTLEESGTQTRVVERGCTANEMFEFVRMIYSDLKNGASKHANNEHFKEDVKLILGIVGASSWFTRQQRQVMRSWSQEQGW